MKKSSLNIQYHEIPIYAVAIAFGEAIRTGRMTEETRKWLEDRSDEYAAALMTGKVVEPQPDGTVKIITLKESGILEEMEEEKRLSDILTLGGEED